MKKLGLLLMMLLILTGCAGKAQTTMEYVEDGFGESTAQPYTIVFGAPDGLTQETFGEASRSNVYYAENGDYSITTEVLDASTVEEAVQSISGFPMDQLEVITLNRFPMDEYRFAWATCGEEESTVSRCALIAGEDYYYVLTMTEKTGLGGTYDSVADYVFSTFGLSMEEEV
ncbi:MAG: hypothetical protein VB055_01315 [Oscillospiraceae bacterium]|nr:hypothetical protein [Oscillospiraceae bacterium]